MMKKKNKGWFSAQKLMDEVNQLSIEELNEFEETNQEEGIVEDQGSAKATPEKNEDETNRPADNELPKTQNLSHKLSQNRFLTKEWLEISRKSKVSKR